MLLPKNGLMAVFGNPEFGAGATKLAQTAKVGDTLAMCALEMHDFGSMLLPPLPGAAQECAALESQAKASGKTVKAFLGAEATEAQLRQLRSPHILHLATHGFFLPETKERDAGPEREARGSAMSSGGVKDEGSKPKVILKNPMHRSGVALAGAQRTLDAWAKGEVPPSDNDGILTAEEAGGLNLKGTWLVTLSACDTGGGEARSGEGVMGLRRGFIQAGAQNLLMTLWPVSDQTTVEIMKEFYAAAEKTGNAPRALADTQRDWLVKLRKDKGLLEAVRLAGPFIMNSQGKQQ